MRSSSCVTGKTLITERSSNFAYTEDTRPPAISHGSIEPKFYAELLALSGLDKEDLTAQYELAQWPALKERVAALIRSTTREEGCRIMEGSDVCVAPGRSQMSSRE